MANHLLRILDQVGVYILCMCIPGFLLALGGIRIIRTKQAVSVSRDYFFRWKRPVLLHGKEAIGPGSCLTIFGFILLLIGLFAIIGVLK